MKTKFEISKNFQFLEMPLVLVYHVGKNFTSISVHQNIDRQNISFNLNHWFGVLKSQLYIVLFFNCMFFSWDDPWLTTILNNTGWQAKFFNWRTLKNSILIKQYPPRWKWADDCQYNSMREKEIVFSFYQYSRLKQNSTCSLNKMSISTYLSSIYDKTFIMYKFFYHKLTCQVTTQKNQWNFEW